MNITVHFIDLDLTFNLRMDEKEEFSSFERIFVCQHKRAPIETSEVSSCEGLRSFSLPGPQRSMWKTSLIRD